MCKIDTIYITIGETELEIDGYCTGGNGIEIEDIKVGGVSVYDLLLNLEYRYKLNFADIQELANEECEEYIDRVYNPENQI